MFLKLKYCCMWRSLKCSWRFSKKFFKNFQSSEEMLSLRGVVYDLRAYSNLFCVVSALLPLFWLRFFRSDLDQDVTSVFVPPVLFFFLREKYPTSTIRCYPVVIFFWALLNFSEPMVCTVKIGFWIELILYGLSNANCDMGIIP
jgi:hypothetical protein